MTLLIHIKPFKFASRVAYQTHKVKLIEFGLFRLIHSKSSAHIYSN